MPAAGPGRKYHRDRDRQRYRPGPRAAEAMASAYKLTSAPVELQVIVPDDRTRADLRTSPAIHQGPELAAVPMIRLAAALVLELAAVVVVLQLFDQVTGPPALHVGLDLVRQSSGPCRRFTRDPSRFSRFIR